jgi:2-dehydropantoate 2-reductase
MILSVIFSEGEKMKIYIVGSGGGGGYLGGLLAKSGKDVTFVARGEHYQKIKEDGLKVKSVTGDFQVRPAQVIERISEIADPDLIIFAVKTYDTEEAARELVPVVNRNTIIITFQNGVDNDHQIKKQVKNAKVYPGVAYVASTKTKPGLIEQTGGPRKFIFGDRNHSQNQKLKGIEKLMREAGADVTVSEDIIRDLWKKFIFIVAFSGMTAICRSPIGKVLGHPITKGLYKICIKEAIQVAKSINIRVENNTFENTMTISGNFQPDSKSSLLVDIENQRRTEIEALNGKLVALAKKKKIHVPINELIYGALLLSSSYT